METKFTPGPWHWQYSPISNLPIALANAERDVLLSTGDDSQAWAEVSPQDMALIASAPELLAHLSILAAEDSQCASDWVKQKEAARLAIQRATEGRT